MIEVICEQAKRNIISVVPGTSLYDISKHVEPLLEYPPLGAYVNNKVRELSYTIFKPKVIRFFDFTDPNGYQMYVRSLSFLLYKALKELYPNAHLLIKHSISGGRYCEINNIDIEITDRVVQELSDRMYQIVAKDIPFIRTEVLTSEAIRLYEQNGLHDKKKLFQSRKLMFTSVYKLENTVDYFYGYLVPSTGYLRKFHVQKYYNGLLLQAPLRLNPDKLPQVRYYDKLFHVFQEHKRWVQILNVAYVGDLNEHVENRTVGTLIKVSEALHEKKLAMIADEIDKRKDVKIVLISGPSSSGKTTFAKRLAIHLQVLGYKSIPISMDDYFVDRQFTPRDEEGNYDFERPDAIDIDLFNQQMHQLLIGKTVNLPSFDFSKGKKFFKGKALRLQPDNILIIEGIHALNPIMSQMVPEERKYKIFVSALTQISIDSHNPIPTTDNRLIRRIVRDYRYRGYSALETLKRWPSVRRGEELYIFPFQEEAHIMFNSALLCELGVLKQYAEPILYEVPETEPEYAEAVRLLKFLSYFKKIPEREIPPTSILREFFGGSSFVY